MSDDDVFTVFEWRDVKHKEVAKHLLNTNIVIANEVSDIKFPAEGDDASLYMHIGEVKKRVSDYATHLQRTSNTSNEEKEELKNANNKRIWDAAEAILRAFTGVIYQPRLAEEVSNILKEKISVNDISSAINTLGKRNKYLELRSAAKNRIEENSAQLVLEKYASDIEKIHSLLPHEATRKPFINLWTDDEIENCIDCIEDFYDYKLKKGHADIILDEIIKRHYSDFRKEIFYTK